MKKIALCLIATCLLLRFCMGQPVAANTADPSTIIIPVTEELTIVKEVSREEKVKALLLKLNEIKTMDKSNLKSFEMKKLRKEKRAIKHEFRETYRGHYSSVGSMIMTELMLFIMF